MMFISPRWKKCSGERSRGRVEDNVIILTPNAAREPMPRLQRANLLPDSRSRGETPVPRRWQILRRSSPEKFPRVATKTLPFQLYQKTGTRAQLATLDVINRLPRTVIALYLLYDDQAVRTPSDNRVWTAYAFSQIPGEQRHGRGTDGLRAWAALLSRPSAV